MGCDARRQQVKTQCIQRDGYRRVPVYILWEQSVPIDAAEVQAELQSSRQKVSLYDNSASPIQLDPGERHDFMVKHDIKEISAYTLICSSSYGTGDGVAHQPQYFKFNAANPLSGDHPGVICKRSQPTPSRVAASTVLEMCSVPVSVLEDQCSQCSQCPFRYTLQSIV